MAQESIRCKLFRGACKLINVKKVFACSAEELIAKSIKENAKKTFKIPNDSDFIYRDMIIMEKYHCLIMQKDEQPAKKALLYCYGGGFVQTCDNGDLKNAKGYGKRTERDVWLPHYPLCTDYCVTESYAMVYETYKEMLKIYKPEDIAIIGFSSGGCLAIGLCCHINALKEHIPMPGLVIAGSPGSVPTTEEDIKKVEELNDVDCIVDKNFVLNIIPTIMKKGQEDVPEYMIYNTLGDFTNFPKIHIYYATHEVLYALSDTFKNVFQKYHVEYEIHIKEGLFHSYPLFTFIPEGKEAEAEIDGYLKE